MSKRILIIDDEDAICQLVRVALEGTRNWQVCTARSGKEGLALAGASPPDAILLDLTMPDMDGLTILQALRANPATQSIPVVFLTGNIPSGARERLANPGVQGIICKPFDILRLAEQIAVDLGWK